MCFHKKLDIGFVIIIVYVDDLNLVRTPKEFTRTCNKLFIEIIWNERS